MSVVVYFFAVAGLVGFLSSGCASEMHWQDPQTAAFEACLGTFQEANCGQDGLEPLDEEICHYWATTTDEHCLAPYTRYQQCLTQVYEALPACEPGAGRSYPNGVDSDPSRCGNEFEALRSCTIEWERPSGECVRHLYPSHNGDVPVCQAMVDYYGCETFDDYNGDGVNDIQDLLDFCQTERDGDSLTLDVDSIPPGGSMQADWCYTCD